MLSLRTVIGALSVSRHCRLGTKGSRSRMHYDINHNFVMQLAGEKQWFLSSLANFTYHGYPAGHSHSRQHYNKNESLEARDQFPPLAHSPQQYRFTMQAGEVLCCQTQEYDKTTTKACTTSVGNWGKARANSPFGKG